jgi:hypothetical protein
VNNDRTVVCSESGIIENAASLAVRAYHLQKVGRQRNGVATERMRYTDLVCDGRHVDESRRAVAPRPEVKIVIFARRYSDSSNPCTFRNRSRRISTVGV